MYKHPFLWWRDVEFYFWRPRDSEGTRVARFQQSFEKIIYVSFFAQLRFFPVLKDSNTIRFCDAPPMAPLNIPFFRENVFVTDV